MKLTILLLLLAAVSQAIEVKSSSGSKQKDDTKTEKRALVEGNSSVEKRAPTPLLPTALPTVTPGIVYADTNELQSDKSPKPLQDVYSTPLPQLAKISDVLTGQGPPFQAAITSHLFSPVSIYQTRLGGYEVSAPIPAQLAYTEKITYQPQAQQLTPQVYRQHQKTNYKLNYQPVQYTVQQIPQPFQPAQIRQLQRVEPNIQPEQLHQFQRLQPQSLQFQPQHPQQVQQVQPQPQPYQQVQYQTPAQPQYIQLQPYQSQFFNQPLQYQNPVTFQFAPQPLAYVQQQLPSQQGIVYTKEEEDKQKPLQRELKTIQAAQQNLNKKEQQEYNTQNRGAVSYASFSVGPTAPSQPEPKQAVKLAPQTQPLLSQFVPQPQPEIQQYQAQAPQQTIHYRAQLQPQGIQPQQQQYQYRAPQQYQVQEAQQKPTQPQFQAQAHQYQIQREPLPQIKQHNDQYHIEVKPQTQVQKQEPSPVNSVNIPAKPVQQFIAKPVAYYQPQPLFHQAQPQVYPEQQIVYQDQAQPVAVPTFPPVQFFGKFAQEIFRNYQQQIKK